MSTMEKVIREIGISANFSHILEGDLVNKREVIVPELKVWNRKLN